jgi:rod shape-determining protein MreC
MARQPASFTRVAQPVRGLWQRFAFLLLIAASFALLLVGKADILIVERARVQITDALAPILEVVSRPAESVGRVVDGARNMFDLQARVSHLQEQNGRLRQWRDVAAGLEVENAALRGLLKYVPPPNSSFISARIIAEAGGPFVRSALINAGRRQGVRRGLAVMSGDGVVGSIVEVGDRHSRVLLVTDLNSQIPVVVHTSRAPAIAVGDNTARMRLNYLPQNSAITPGDRIETSGHGGMFPAGLPVGTVTAVGENEVRVAPLIDWERLEYVRVIDFGLEGVVGVARGETPPHTVLAPTNSSSSQR